MKVDAMLWKKLILCLLLLLTASIVLTAPTGLKVTGIYSDMYYNMEAGDVLGVEIFVLFSRDGYYVLFQDTTGMPSVPILVKAKIDGNRIKFTLPDRSGYPSGYSGKFDGVIYRNELKGKFEDGQISDTSGTSIFILKRRHSYWQNE